MKKYVLSERKTKAVAALAGLTLTELNIKAGLGASYMSRKWGKDNIELSTVNKIAAVIGCSAIDLLEESDMEQPSALRTSESAATQLRTQERASLPGVSLTPEEQARAQQMEERRTALLAQARQRNAPE